MGYVCRAKFGTGSIAGRCGLLTSPFYSVKLLFVFVFVHLCVDYCV